MLVDPNGLFDAILRGLERLPYALIAVVLLGGPTAVWLIARFISPPDAATPEYTGLEILLWVCPSCRSLNDDRLEACYACHRLRPAEDAGMFEPAHRNAPGVGIPVGPGRPSHQPISPSWLGGDLESASHVEYEEPEPAEAITPDETVDAFEPRIVEPLMKVSGRPSGSQPAKRPRGAKNTADGAGKTAREPAPKPARKTGRRAS
jgi:hypothetical protein